MRFLKKLYIRIFLTRFVYPLCYQALRINSSL